MKTNLWNLYTRWYSKFLLILVICIFKMKIIFIRKLSQIIMDQFDYMKN